MRAVVAAFFAVSLTVSVARSQPQASDKSAAPASAPEKDASKAQEWFQLGRSAYDRGDYEAALAAFQASYELSRQPILMFNIAQALRLLGRCDSALDYYQRYRDLGQELPSDFNELVSQAESCATPKPAPAATPSPAATSPEPSNVTAPPPTAATAPPAPAPDRAPTTTGGWDWTRWTGAACVLVAVGSGVAGTVFALRAEEIEDEISQLSKDGGTWTDKFQARDEEGQQASMLAIGFYSAAAVAGGVGLWLLLRPNEPQAASLGVSPTPGGAWIAWRSQF